MTINCIIIKGFLFTKYHISKAIDNTVKMWIRFGDWLDYVLKKAVEADLAIAKLVELKDRMAANTDLPAHVRDRIGRMHEFISTLTSWYEQVRGLKKSTLISLMKMGAKVARFIPGSAKDWSKKEKENATLPTVYPLISIFTENTKNSNLRKGTWSWPY